MLKNCSSIADCLRDLGRLDDAAAVYEEDIKYAEIRNDKRSIAVTKFQLGTVRLRQRRYPEALQLYAEARDTFANLGEPRMVAGAWHQMGRVHSQVGEFDLAEQAYRQALAATVQLKDLASEAMCLNELGTLYYLMGRLEEAAAFYRQAADIFGRLKNLRYEGVARSNLADKLIKLQRYDEAHRELQRAIECKQPYGHVAEPWLTWKILHDLEQATGNAQAAGQAQRQATQSYLAYRRDGGENQSSGAQWCAAVGQLIQQGAADKGLEELAKILSPASPDWAKALISKLQAILHGSRDPALADDPALEYDDAAEVLLLLERLGV